jgi:hypothetical protein
MGELEPRRKKVREGEEKVKNEDVDFITFWGRFLPEMKYSTRSPSSWTTKRKT